MKRNVKKKITFCFLPWNNIDNINDLPDLKVCSLSLVEMQDADRSLGDEEWEIIESIGLTNRQIQCVWLYYYKKLTQYQIADILGITRPVVTIYLQRAKSRIAKYFGTSTGGGRK